MDNQKIRIAMLDDHQSILDGYRLRIQQDPDLEVVATGSTGEELDGLLTGMDIDVLLLDVQVPISKNNPNPYPVIHEIKRILDRYPNVSILAISMYAVPSLIKTIMEAGASGYILKDDNETIRELPSVIRSIASGGIHMSQKAFLKFQQRQQEQLKEALTPRQLEAISLCAAYPDATSAELAAKMNISNSTFRNTLSQAYMKLDVRTRPAAISQARSLGIISPGDFQEKSPYN